jgi:hypothetical protein
MNFDVLADDLGVHRTTSLWRRTLYCVLTPVSVQVVIPAEARSFSRADEGSLHLKLNSNFPPGRKTKPKIQKLAGG